MAEATPLRWGSFLGGPGEDGIWDIATDGEGTIAAVGQAWTGFLSETATAPFSSDDVSGPPDAFVCKLDAATGQVIFKGFLGGAGNDCAIGAALAPDGRIAIVGHTASDDFPTTGDWPRGGGRDVFIAVIAADGSALLASAILGGGSEDVATSVSFDRAGNLIVSGHTGSPDFPTTPGSFQPVYGGGRFDAFVLRIDPARIPEGLDASLEYGTFLGGSNHDTLRDPDTGEDWFFDRLQVGDHALDPGDDAIVYLTGATASADFPATPGAFRPAKGPYYEAYVTVLRMEESAERDEALLYSTFAGGNSGTLATAMALDPKGGAWITGWTYASDYPVTSGAHQRAKASNDDAFVTLIATDTGLDPAAQLVYSTFAGGDSYDWGTDLRTLPDGRVILVGFAMSSNLYQLWATPGQLAPVGPGGFLVFLDPATVDRRMYRLLYASPISGWGLGHQVLACDPEGVVFAASSQAGNTFAGITAGPGHMGLEGLLLALDLRHPRADFTTEALGGGSFRVDAAASSTAPGTEPMTFAWDFGDGGTGEGITTSHTYAHPGRYLITLTLTNGVDLAGTASAVVAVPCDGGEVSPWTAADVGSPLLPGCAWREGEAIAICAGGRRILGPADELLHVHREVRGDFAVVVRITDVEGGGVGAFVGPMMRESLDPGARYAAILLEKPMGTIRLRFRYRERAGATGGVKTGGVTAVPRWLRLERRGDEFVAWSRPDEGEWEEAYRTTLAGMPETLYAGVAAAGEDSDDENQPFAPLRARLEDLEIISLVQTFRRGDANGDGQFDLGDAIAILNYLFNDGPMTCIDAADVDDDGRAIIADPIRLVYHIFVQGPPPPAPYPGCGADPTADGLG
ncbi:MAG: PKD domain-containing protein, partial [Planctomycetes bacterium]|nr:PKD domain-containing protein [Planctomycetota bacterium]